MHIIIIILELTKIIFNSNLDIFYYLLTFDKLKLDMILFLEKITIKFKAIKS